MPRVTTDQYTPQHKLSCIRREIQQRRRVYPRLVKGGKMSPRDAQQQIEIMVAIAADYEAQVTDLFHPEASSGPR